MRTSFLDLHINDIVSGRVVAPVYQYYSAYFRGRPGGDILATRGAFHQVSLSVIFTDNCYKLLKSLHLIG